MEDKWKLFLSAGNSNGKLHEKSLPATVKKSARNTSSFRNNNIVMQYDRKKIM